MVDSEILRKIVALPEDGGCVKVDCYDPDCPFVIALKVGELPVEIKYSEYNNKFVASCVAYSSSSNPCNVPDMVLGDLELELKGDF